MRTIRLEIELTYDDDIMHGGDHDQEAKAWFYHQLLHPEEGRVMAIRLLAEAVEKLLAVNHLHDATDEELDGHAENGYAPEIKEECESVLFAREVMRMTNYFRGQRRFEGRGMNGVGTQTDSIRDSPAQSVAAGSAPIPRPSPHHYERFETTPGAPRDTAMHR